MSFQIHGLPREEFNHLFGMDDDNLAALGIERMLVNAKPGFPCRVSLEDADVGSSVLLMNFEHQPAQSPYRSSHAIFVREGAEQAAFAEGEIPDMLRVRQLSVRAFDKDGMMVDATMVDGGDLESAIERLFAAPSSRYIHVHNAARGCFMARIERIGDKLPF